PLAPGLHVLVGGDEAGRLERRRPVDGDAAGGDELAGALAAGGEAPAHELGVEAAADGRRRRPPRQPEEAPPAPDEPPVAVLPPLDRAAAFRVEVFFAAAFFLAGAFFAGAFSAGAFSAGAFLVVAFALDAFRAVLLAVAVFAAAVVAGAFVPAAGASASGSAPRPVAWPTNERAVSTTRCTMRSMSSRVARSRREICWSISDRTVSMSRSRLWRLRSSSSSTAVWACSDCTAPARTRSRTTSSARCRVSAVNVIPASRSRLSRSFSAIPPEVTAGRARWQCPPRAWPAWARRRPGRARPAGPPPA